MTKPAPKAQAGDGKAKEALKAALGAGSAADNGAAKDTLKYNCPAEGRFGYHCDIYHECADCKIWPACRDALDEIEAEDDTKDKDGPVPTSGPKETTTSNIGDCAFDAEWDWGGPEDDDQENNSEDEDETGQDNPLSLLEPPITTLIFGAAASKLLRKIVKSFIDGFRIYEDDEGTKWHKQSLRIMAAQAMISVRSIQRAQDVLQCERLIDIAHSVSSDRTTFWRVIPDRYSRFSIFARALFSSRRYNGKFDLNQWEIWVENNKKVFCEFKHLIPTKAKFYKTFDGQGPVRLRAKK